MATFKVIRDNRYKRRDGSNRYCLKVSANGKNYYVHLDFNLTPQQHTLVFEKKSMARDAIEFRKQVSDLETKAARTYSSMRLFEIERFRTLFNDKDAVVKPIESDLPKSLALKELFEFYARKNPGKINTNTHKKSSLSALEKYQRNLYVDDITVPFLKQFERDMLSNGSSLASVSSYLRDLRTIINYFQSTKRIIPNDYQYPFGKGGYSIKNFRRKKSVLSNEEILKVIEFDDFDSSKQEYARNIWLVLYYGSGINPIDLLKLRWKNRERNGIRLIRTKRETTRQSELQEIYIPLTQNLRYYLNKVAIPEEISPFVLGKLHEGYSEQSLVNRKNRFRQEINPELRRIKEKLGLSAPLTMASARDAYASSLNRNGTSRAAISEMLGHQDLRTTNHYLDSLSSDKAHQINEGLVSRTKDTIM
jgi:integrase